MGKDLNESLVANRQETELYLQEQAAACLAQMPPPYKTLSAAGQLEALNTYIQNQAKTPACPLDFSPWIRLLMAVCMTDYMCWVPSVPWEKRLSVCKLRMLWLGKIKMS